MRYSAVSEFFHSEVIDFFEVSIGGNERCSSVSGDSGEHYVADWNALSPLL